MVNKIDWVMRVSYWPVKELPCILSRFSYTWKLKRAALTPILPWRPQQASANLHALYLGLEAGWFQNLDTFLRLAKLSWTRHNASACQAGMAASADASAAVSA